MGTFPGVNEISGEYPRRILDLSFSSPRGLNDGLTYFFLVASAGLSKGFSPYLLTGG